MVAAEETPPVDEMTVRVVTLPGAAALLRSEKVPAASTLAVPISRPVTPEPSTMATRWPARIEDVPLTRHSPRVRYLASMPVIDSACGFTVTVSLASTPLTPFVVSSSTMGSLLTV